MRLHLVPSERQVEALAREGHTAKTLRQLVQELADAAAAGRERAGPEVTRLIAETVTPKPDLAELLDAGLGALRKIGVGAAQLQKLPGKRARLFAQTLERADRALSQAQLRDERGDAWLASSGVGPDCLPGVTELLVVGWARLGAGELTLLERLHGELRQRGGGVSLRFPGVSGDESRRAVDNEQARLEARWAEHNDAPSMLRDEEVPASRLRLRLTRTPNMASEACAVVRAVQEKLAAGGRLDRIAIVPLDLSEAFLEELRSALWSAKLPFSEPRGRPPVAGPNVHAALELLRLVGGPIRRDALLDVLAAPGLRPDRWFGDGGRAALHTLRELLARTPVGFDKDGTLLLAHAKRLAEQRPSPAGAAALLALVRVLQDLRGLGFAQTRASLVRDFSALLEGLGLLQLSPATLRLALEARDAGAPGLLTALSDDARGSATLAQALARLVEAAERLGLSDVPVSPRELSAELLRAMEGVNQSRGAARAAAIAIARPLEVAGLPLDLAVVCRASTACFSQMGASAASLWLGAELCEALPRFQRPPSARDEEAATLTALNALLAGAAETELVWSTSDGSSDTRESRFVEALAHATGVTAHNEPGSPLAPGARRIRPLPAVNEGINLRVEAELCRHAFFFGQGALSAWTGQVSELSAWIAPELPPLPVTRLERYADCAFLGFSAIVLRATRDEGVTDALGVRERGILIHAAVAEALSAIAGLTRPDHELLALALAAADGALEKHAGSALRGAALRTTRGDVRSLVRWSLEHRDYAFREAEKGFGEGEAWAPMQLGPYRLSGRIDRIDVSSDGQRARVIDYKSGQPPSRNDEHALQGWLYARKVAAELGTSEVQSLYLGLSRRVPVPKEIYSGAPDGTELIDRERFALGKLEALRRGLVPAEPSRPGRCERCDGRDLCRRPLSAPAPEEGGDDS
ncbi:MAG: PD-(D/E)XK nuclease family protein [Myxococcales bacterium]